VHVTCPAHLILLDRFILIIIWWWVQIIKLLIMSSLQPLATSSLRFMYSPEHTVLSYSHSVLLHVQFSNPYKTK
jgi:hypothetical protein